MSACAIRAGLHESKLRAFCNFSTCQSIVLYHRSVGCLMEWMVMDLRVLSGEVLFGIMDHGDALSPFCQSMALMLLGQFSVSQRPKQFEVIHPSISHNHSDAQRNYIANANVR